MERIVVWINHFVWGIPALLLILGVGIYYTFSTKFVQLRLLPAALKSFGNIIFGKHRDNEDVSPFQALCTALAATVGTGNIAGVAGAIAIGGPGSIFWMWISALLGMVLKYAEAVLAVRFAQRDSAGNTVSGPMYMIRYGMGISWNWLACMYCIFGVIAAFGIGNATQINAVISGIRSAISSLDVTPSKYLDVIVAVVAAGIIAIALLGGAKRVGGVAELLVPFAAVAYIVMCFGVLVVRAERIPEAFTAILSGAFSPNALTGGAIGSAFISLRTGISRGVFTNEAGMGTASIAHGGAKVRHPAEQGLMGIIEVFLDTIVICTLTALVILCSGILIPYGTDEGATLTARAFSQVYGQWSSIPLALFLCLFAFATMLGWGLYGVRCAQYLLGDRFVKCFIAIQSLTIIASIFLKTGTVWLLSETVNGLMAIPNLIALGYLNPIVLKLTKDYIISSAPD